MKFQDELLRINTLHKNDPIAVIWPETGVEINREDLSFEKDATVILNKRDAQAQKKIIEIMDSTDKPGMIFYGSGHGLKMPRVYYHNTDSEWKMLGSYLYDYYGSDYCAPRSKAVEDTSSFFQIFFQRNQGPESNDCL